MLCAPVLASLAATIFSASLLELYLAEARIGPDAGGYLHASYYGVLVRFRLWAIVDFAPYVAVKPMWL